jgi:hypothetical protein
LSARALISEFEGKFDSKYVKYLQSETVISTARHRCRVWQNIVARSIGAIE